MALRRNAVIGKVHRLGMSGRVKTRGAGDRPAKTESHPTGGASALKHAAMRGNTALAMPTQPNTAMLPEPTEEDVVIPMSEMVTIMELKESMCRWPIGDPASADFRFCGAKKRCKPSGPYCAYHSRIAYQPVQDRRRERAPSG